MAGPLVLPLILLGPRSGGRSYGVLRQPTDLTLSAVARDRLADLALALHEWSRGTEARLSAFLPLDREAGEWLLLRAENLGASALGEVARASGAVLTRSQLDAIGWAVHRLAPLLPSPADDGGDGGEVLSLLDLPAAAPVQAIGAVDVVSSALAWEDFLIRAPDDASAQAVLNALLEAERPPQRMIDGWSVGGLLARHGRFDPDEAFRLVVLPASASPANDALPGHHTAVLRDGRLVGETVREPDAWLTWEALFEPRGATGVARPDAAWKAVTDVQRRDFRIDPEVDAHLARLRWRPQLRDLKPDECVCLLAVEAAQGLDPPSQIMLLHRLALAGRGILDEPLAVAARRGLALALGDLVSKDPPVAAMQIDAYLKLVEPHLGDVFAAMPARIALDRKALGRLAAPIIQEMSRGVLASALAEPAAAFVRGELPGPEVLGPMMSGLAEAVGAGRAAPAAKALLPELMISYAASAPGGGAALAQALGASRLTDAPAIAPDLVASPVWARLSAEAAARPGGPAPGVQARLIRSLRHAPEVETADRPRQIRYLRAAVAIAQAGARGWGAAA